jgi:hypothetical protein
MNVLSAPRTNDEGPANMDLAPGVALHVCSDANSYALEAALAQFRCRRPWQNDPKCIRIPHSPGDPAQILLGLGQANGALVPDFSLGPSTLMQLLAQLFANIHQQAVGGGFADEVSLFISPLRWSDCLALHVSIARTRS